MAVIGVAQECVAIADHRRQLLSVMDELRDSPDDPYTTEINAQQT
jgi:hypothetical protein